MKLLFSKQRYRDSFNKEKEYYSIKLIHELREKLGNHEYREIFEIEYKLVNESKYLGELTISQLKEQLPEIKKKLLNKVEETRKVIVELHKLGFTTRYG
jgi:hypothetical protein